MFQNFAVQESFLWWWKHSVSCHLIWWSQHMWLPCSWIMSNVTEELIADPTGWQLILIYVYTYICLYCACECSWGCTRAQCNMWRSDVNLKFWCMRISTFKAVPLIDLDCCHRSQATWPTSFYELFCCLLPYSHHHGYRCAWFSTPVTFRYGAWLYFPWGNRVGEASLGGADEHTAKGGSTPRATSTLVLLTGFTAWHWVYLYFPFLGQAAQDWTIQLGPKETLESTLWEVRAPWQPYSLS